MNTEQTRNLNPLTGLPANRLVIQNLRQILTEHSAAAVYLDLTDFKPYNEVYGFAAGDRVIVGFARMVEKILTGICKEKNFFLGHIGGDDFFFSTRLQFVDQIFKLIDREFIALRESFYSASDKARSSIIAFNRKGEREKFPLMGVCGAAFSPRRENIYSAEEAAAFATYLKDTAKKLRVSDNIFINPEKLDIIPGGLPEFSLDKKIPLAKRRAAIESMGQSGMAHYGRALIKIYYKTDEIMIKKSVLYALGKLRYLPARSLIEKAFNSENAHLRTRAVEAMGSIGGAEDTDKIGAMIKDPNPYTAAMAAKALALTGSPKALSYLKNIPQSAPVRLKMEAANSRALLKDPESIKELGKRIKDANPLLRKKASKALSFIKTPASLKILIKSFLKEKTSQVRETQLIAAARICQQLSGPELKPFNWALKKMYKKSPDKIKPLFFPVIKKISAQNFNLELEKNMASNSGFVRLKVTEALACSNKKKHREYILSRLMDNYPPARQKSAYIIGQSGKIEDIEALRLALKDKDSHVRKAAAEAIIKLVSSRRQEKSKK